MSGAHISTRVDEVISASINQSAGGSLTVGPFSRDVIVNRFGAVITTATDTGATAITTSPDVGSASVPSGTGANKSVVKDAVASPSAVDGSQPGQYVLTKGATLTVTSAAVGASGGAYRLFAEVIKLPLPVDGTNVIAG